MNDLLKGQVCLVTGATRGIGKAIAGAFAAQGATVFGTATSAAGAERISEHLAPCGGSGMVLDVTDASQPAEVVKQVTDQAGAPLVLVNNAGITRDNLLLRMSEQEWDEIMQTNLRSVFLMSKAVLRGMTKARAGRIINIASVVGVTGNAGQANYAAAKSGMIGFSKSLAQEVASRNITVNTIAPGFIETDMTAALSDEQRDAISSKIPLGRLGSPEDIGHCALYLASDMGAYVTGQTLHVNGGMAMV